MKIRISRTLVLIFACFSCYFSSAQDTPFSVETKGLFHKKIIKRCGFELTHQQLVEFMATDPLMDDYTKPMAGLYLTNTLLNATGSVLSTWPLWQLQFDRDPNLNLTYVGLGVMIGSIILNKLFMKKSIQAVEFYNNGYVRPSKESGVLLKPASKGVGIALTF